MKNQTPYELNKNEYDEAEFQDIKKKAQKINRFSNYITVVVLLGCAVWVVYSWNTTLGQI